MNVTGHVPMLTFTTTTRVTTRITRKSRSWPTCFVQTDIDCSGFVGQNAQTALDQGVITGADLDARLEKAVRVRMRLAHFDQEGPLDALGAKDVCTPETIATSWDGTAQGATLIKNVGNTLPLQAGTTVAVIGPGANLSHAMAGYYGATQVCNGDMNNAVDAVARFMKATPSALGVPDVKSSDTSRSPTLPRWPRPQTMSCSPWARTAWAREGSVQRPSPSPMVKRRSSRRLRSGEEPVTLLLLTATPLDLIAQLANDKIGAILHVGQPSVAVMGVADVLFDAKSPAGRLIQTVYPQSYENEVSIFDWHEARSIPLPRPDCTAPVAQCPNATNPGRTHRVYTGKAVLDFGFGLSYSTFKYEPSSSASGPVSLAPVRDMLAATKAAGRTFPARADVARRSRSELQCQGDQHGQGRFG